LCFSCVAPPSTPPFHTRPSSDLLADAGFEVVVVDQAPRPGGRASAFTDRATGERVDNGQHVLFGCYEETYAFLRLIGAEALAPRSEEHTSELQSRENLVCRLLLE